MYSKGVEMLANVEWMKEPEKEETSGKRGKTKRRRKGGNKGTAEKRGKTQQLCQHGRESWETCRRLLVTNSRMEKN